MALIVQKYGGTSVGSPERIGKVADRVKRWRDRGNDWGSTHFNSGIPNRVA